MAGFEMAMKKFHVFSLLIVLCRLKYERQLHPVLSNFRTNGGIFLP
jgi:hypothetical protein